MMPTTGLITTTHAEGFDFTQPPGVPIVDLADNVRYDVTVTMDSGPVTFPNIRPSNRRPSIEFAIEAAQPGDVCMVHWSAGVARFLIVEGFAPDVVDCGGNP